MQLDREQIKNEIRAAIREWKATLPTGKRATALEIRDALMPFVQKKAHYNQYLKSLTELTLDAAGLDEDHLEYRPGERPRLKSVPIRVGCAPQYMKRTFFTSDHHFGHANILKYEDANRRNAHGGKFASIEKMDEYLIKQWNATVAPGDLVYCLGDLSYKQHTLEAVLPRLNGTKILIVGNHDPYFNRLTCVMERMHKEAREDALQAGFSAVHLQLDIEIAGIGLTRLSHFPYWPSETEGVADYDLRYPEHRPPQGSEALLLHGHIHSQWQTKTEPDMPPMINVGIDMWSLRPISEAEIVQKYQEILL